MTQPYRKKLIEVALPLEAINRESAREKSIRHGHPSTLHLWWARRPLAACRAVLFASIVDDPSSRPDLFPTEDDQDAERERLFRLIEELVKWENSNNDDVLQVAREEILRSTGGDPPPVLDPFCGGGSIPLEAQRLGLEAYASDLNPVAVLITKALIEIPPRFDAQPPVNPESMTELGHTATWKGAQGLAEDVRYYGDWMRERAFERLGHLYPKTMSANGSELDPIAWIWARTIPCQNPACGSLTPLATTWWLSKKPGHQWSIALELEADKSVSYQVQPGAPSASASVTRRGANCVVCGALIPLDVVRGLGREQGFKSDLVAIVATDGRSRVYLSPDAQHRSAAEMEIPEEAPTQSLPDEGLGFRVQGYGFHEWVDLYTPRQLHTLTALASLVPVATLQARSDGATAEYSRAIGTYLALFVGKMADLNNAFCQWRPDAAKQHIGHLFTRQAVPMVWDFAEANPFGNSAGGWDNTFQFIPKVLEALPSGLRPAHVRQLDAASVTSVHLTSSSCVSTDPPYYDNVGYADLSDFFYVWLRECLKDEESELLSTIGTPKQKELIADPSRHGGRPAARRHFEDGMKDVFDAIRIVQKPVWPLTVFYAFKQSETNETDGSTSSTGWETMLEGLIASNYTIEGTWPMRSELGNRMRNIDSNALASSIVLVCRPRREDAPITARRDFVSALRDELPVALKTLQHGSIAPVDLAQAAIGPGMSVFTRYAKVLESSGSPMMVRTALALINQVLDEILTEQEGDLDAASRFAVAWYEQRGFEEGPFGEAETLATAKAISVRAIEQAGILSARAGRARLLRRDELDPNWDPATDERPTVWEAALHLVQRLENGGEPAAADLLERLGGIGQTARELAYRLYTISERKGRVQEALGFNALAVAWLEIARLAANREVIQQSLEV